MAKGKVLKNFLVVTLPTLLIVFLILEVFFRIGIKASDTPRPLKNLSDSLVTYDKNYPTGIYTYGSFAEVNAKWTINNMGWNYPIDYVNDTTKPLIAVVGDSYIAALEVDSDKNYAYLMHKKFLGKANVFAFGLQGAPLSQYLDYTRYIRKHFKPAVFIINFCHNDFDQSVLGLYPSKNVFKLVSVNDSVVTEIPPKLDSVKLPLENRFVDLVYKSAVVRYIYRNTHIVQNVKKIFGKGKPEDSVRVSVAQANFDKIKLTTKYVIGKMMSENPETKFLFVIDAPRNSIYNNELSSSNVIWINKMLFDLSKEMHFELLDLTESMNEDYKKNKVKFNFEVDGHWNEYAHRFIADKIFNLVK